GLFTQVVAQLPLLIPAQRSGTPEPAAGSGELPQWLRTIVPTFVKLNWSQALDFFSGSRAWQEKRFIRPGNVVPQEVPAEGEGQPGPATREEPNFEESVEGTAAPAWALAVALAVRTPREPGRRHGLRRVRPRQGRS